jgi:uncharacterized membrane protein (UPF0127 family)
MKIIFAFMILIGASSSFGRDLNAEYKKVKLTVGGKTIDVFLADNDERRERGLMFTHEIAPNTGMLFIFEQEQPLAFWMKNTLIPLSIGFFNKEGVLVDVQEMTVPASIMDQRPPSYPSKKPAMYALEMNKNWFTSNKIKPGAKLSLTKLPRP